MTKIAYIRATNRQYQQQQQQQQQSISMNQSILKPTIPSMMQQPRPSFPNPQTTRMIMMNNQNNPLPPRPMIMTPTTRFNSNPNILLGLDQQQQNGQRISKPLMEKRRRARINQCLTQLKLIVVDSAGQYTQNNKCKLEKADILELTVNYVKKLHQEHQQQQQEKSTKINDNDYLSGYSECVRQICEYLTKNQTQISYDSVKDFLQQSLSITYQQHKHHDQQAATTFVTPPSPAPSSESNHGCSPTTAAAATTTRIKIESNSESIKSSSIITNCRKRKRINESDTDDNNTDNDEDYYYDYDDDDVIDDNDDDDFGYGSDHQQQENYPLNLKIVKLDNPQPKQQHGYFDDNDDVWRPW